MNGGWGRHRRLFYRKTDEDRNCGCPLPGDNNPGGLSRLVRIGHGPEGTNHMHESGVQGRRCEHVHGKSVMRDWTEL